jgi:hypothetical protein
MRRFLGLVVATLLVGLGLSARAGDDKAARALVDKGIQALGGADKLGKAKAMTWKTKGKVSFGGTDNEFTGTVTVQGLDHLHQELDGVFGGNKVKILMIMAGNKGWRGFNGENQPLDDDTLATQKRGIYLQVVPATLVPLTEKGFKVASAPDDMVDGKPAAGIKVTAPDGKDFKLYFDKQSGLPVKLVATVAGFMGGEFEQVTTFANYKDFGGIKKATKIVSTRDGQKFMESEITDFAVVDKLDPKLFAEPK